MKKLVSIAVISILLTSAFYALNVNIAHSQLTTLTPGQPATITQTLDVNVVFVGFDPSWIDVPAFNSWQLPDLDNVIRSRLWYGIVEPLGLHFDFTYNVIFSEDIDADFDDDYFTYIIGIGTPPGLTLRQQSYNGLSAAERSGYTIPAPNYMVEAEQAESWLEANAPRLGIDAVNEYTLFFLNGYDYYPAHTYWFIDEPDPDTGVVFGAYGSRVLTAWGGQFGRSWFLDVSAGPDRFLFRSLLPNPSTYSTAVRPIWEFTQLGGYRTDLTERLAKITRGVGVDMLFTPSPLYPPYIQPPVLPEHIQFDVNMFEQNPTFASEVYNGADWFQPDVMTAAYEDFEPYLTFSATFQDRMLTDYPVLKKALENFFSGNPYSIFGKRSPYYDAAAGGIDLHLYFSSTLFRFLTEEEGSQADYSVPIFSYAVDDDYMGVQWGLGGFADDNWVDGTQEYIETFNTPYWAAVGYGYTLTAIHEAGHHICLSHPHDGYDPVTGSVGALIGQSAWAGDHSYTVMNYHDITYHFGVFNKDSMYRYMTIEYLNYANKILKWIYDNPHAGDVADMIANADTLATDALADYQAMNYLSAVEKMKSAYDTIVEAALTLKIALEPYNWHSTYKARTVTIYDPLVDP
jgi:hypothetical protein